MAKKILVGIMFLGLGLVIVGLVLTQGDFNKTINAFVVSEEYEYMEKSNKDTFDNIYIDVVSNNINFYKSETEEVKITYYESEYDKINFSIDNSKLSIIGNYKNKFRFFNFRIKPREVKNVDIYIPEYFNGSVDIEIVSGNLNINGFDFKKLETDLTSGNQTLKNINIKENMNLINTSGSMNLDTVKIDGDLSIDITSGSVTANIIEVNKMNIDITSGKGKITRATFNHFDIDVTSGDIDLSVLGNKDDYSANLDVTSGTINFGGVKLKSQKFNQGKSKSITVDVTSGDIKINFVNN